MFRLLPFLLVLLPSTIFSQLYINKSKSSVKEEISKIFSGKNNITVTLSETDSSLSMKTRGTGTIEADYLYSFDKAGKCSAEKTVTWCDSCNDKLLQQVLGEKKYEWKKINLNQYISKFEVGVFLELQVTGNTYSFTIYRTNLNKKMYKFLMENNH
jgi:hypothetical protein